MSRFISSAEVKNIALLWEPVHIFDIDKKAVLGSVTRNVSDPNNLVGFSDHHRRLLIELLEKAYDSGCRHIGFVAPEYLRDTVVNAALRVSYDADGQWTVDELEGDHYPELVNEAQIRLLAKASTRYDETMIAQNLAAIEQRMMDMMGFNTKTLVALYGVTPEREADLKLLEKALASEKNTAQTTSPQQGR